MAKRKHSKQVPGKPRSQQFKAKITLQQREARVQSAIEYGHDKDAIIQLKQMLALERRPEWVDLANQAHQRLTGRLFSQGQYKEVIGLYESGQRVCGFSLDSGVYIQSLLQLNQIPRATGIYRSAFDLLGKAELFNLRAVMGAIALSGERRMIDLLMTDDPVVADFDKAFTALKAWCSGDDSRLEENLKQLSFRSPYRDLRTLLSTCLAARDGVDIGARLLERIGEDSPYRHWAGLVNDATLESRKVVTLLPQLCHEERLFVLQLKGWNGGKDKLAVKLSRLPEAPDYGSLFRLADGFKPMDLPYLSHVAKIAAIHGSAYGSRTVSLKRFARRFEPLDTEPYAHAEALVASLVYDHRAMGDRPSAFFDQEQAWVGYHHVLVNNDRVEHWQLSTALIIRHMVKLWVDSGRPMVPKAVKSLEDSLHSDPFDVPTQLSVIQYHQEHSSLRVARSAVNNALKVYPDHLSILLTAIQIAVAGHAFKKAAGYAKKILSVDPINPEARRLLQGAHLSHARKQAVLGKWQIVKKELDEAAEWAKTPISRIPGLILKACYELKAGQADQAPGLLQEAVTLAGTPINACLIFRLEAKSIRFQANLLYKQVGLRFPPKPLGRKQDLLTFIEFSENLLQYHDNESLADALNQFHRPLNGVKKLGLDQQEFEQVCEFWLRIRQNKLLLRYAKEASRRFDDEPIFIFFTYAANTSLNFDEFFQLEGAMHMAQEAGNNRLAVRIGNFLETFPSPFEPDEDVFSQAEAGFGSPEAELESHEDWVRSIYADDLDEVIMTMSREIGIPIEVMTGLREFFGDQKLREFIVATLEGNQEKLQKMLTDFEASDNNKPGRENAAIDPSQLNLFE